MSYRYHLSRVWNWGLPTGAFIMLNPSTADDIKDDPTIRRCIAFAKHWNWGGFQVGNLWAYRSTEPKGLTEASDPYGPHNDKALNDVCSQASAGIVCAWGTWGRWQDAGPKMIRQLLDCGMAPSYIRLTKGGHPAHPLYLPGALMPQYWRK